MHLFSSSSPYYICCHEKVSVLGCRKQHEESNIYKEPDREDPERVRNTPIFYTLSVDVISYVSISLSINFHDCSFEIKLIIGIDSPSLL